ncbi:alpha/beta fold hydrolase [Nocardia yamanashiensis]|uniref:alpha/beta fold hydrolase n=1 Tax=Nocardia yamanashiensis TaxID=209247 RepID=UPI000A546C58|nr:alpha/beta hydrolase [Nocardia yamanashiensis]
MTTMVRAALALAIAAAGMTMAPARGHAEADTVCREVNIPVQLAGRTERMWGEICDPAGGPSTVLQVLIPGITYDHHYWDMPGFDGKYSYARYAAAAGYSTLAIDRLGTGNSSRPTALELTTVTHADTVHQLVQAVRDGELGARWDKVVTVGHSLGTLIAEQEAAVYRDVDGVIATGWLIPPGVVASVGMLARHGVAAPENGVPQGDSLPLYLTMTPGSRSFFYKAGNYDPELLAADERYKQTDTVGEMMTIPVPWVSAALAPISAPALLVVGESDSFFCSPPEHTACTAEQVVESQRLFYGPQSNLQAHVQPGSGHNIALSLNNHDGYDAMLAWVRVNFQD